MAVEELRKNDMMAHLLDALDQKKDIGHYGIHEFAMVERHFQSEDELIGYLTKDSDFNETEARSLYQQVQGKDYNPPKRERVLQWQEQQDFPICPNADDPDACNVYKDLQFPDHVYEHISEYYQHKGGQLLKSSTEEAAAP